MVMLTVHCPKLQPASLHMRNFKDGETIWVEPFRAKAFPVIKDLMVDRSGFDKILTGWWICFHKHWRSS